MFLSFKKYTQVFMGKGTWKTFELKPLLDTFLWTKFSLQSTSCLTVSVVTIYGVFFETPGFVHLVATIECQCI